MKNILKMGLVLMAGALVFSSCNCFKNKACLDSCDCIWLYTL